MIFLAVLRMVSRVSAEEKIEEGELLYETLPDYSQLSSLIQSFIRPQLEFLLCFVFSDVFLYVQGVFPACYIHLKEATVEGSGSVCPFIFLKVYLLNMKESISNILADITVAL